MKRHIGLVMMVVGLAMIAVALFLPSRITTYVPTNRVSPIVWI